MGAFTKSQDFFDIPNWLSSCFLTHLETIIFDTLDKNIPPVVPFSV